MLKPLLISFGLLLPNCAFAQDCVILLHGLARSEASFALQALAAFVWVNGPAGRQLGTDSSSFSNRLPKTNLSIHLYMADGDDSSSNIRFADITAPPHWAARMTAIIAKTG